MESDGGGGGGGGRRGEAKFSRAVSTRTLTDVIHDEGGDGDGDGGGTKEERRSWRHFKDKIRNQGRRSGGGGSTWTSTVAVPASDVPIQTSKKRVMFRHSSGRVSAAPDADPGMPQPDIAAVPDFRSSSLRRNSSGRSGDRSARFDSDPSPLRRLQEEAAEEEAAAEEGMAAAAAEEEAAEDEKPVKMSLMSLLAESDDEYGMDDDDEDEDEDEVGGGGGAYTNCCICMVRHKGAAFEPCGHSFCRLCSKEMWVQGGNCPLCNNYVLEILDIF